jgi:uncharacterized protein (TIGR02246 family)
MKGLTMTGHDSSADRAAADGAVRAVLDGLYAARAVGGAGAVIAPYASDATVVLPGSYPAGRDELRAAMTDATAGSLTGSRVGHEVQSMRFSDAGAFRKLPAGSGLSQQSYREDQ